MLRPHRSALTAVYLVHVLSTFQVDLGATGDLVCWGRLGDNDTQLIWASVASGRRRGERSLSLPPAEEQQQLPQEWKQQQQQQQQQQRRTWVRFLVLPGNSESAAAFTHQLAMTARALVPGGILALEGLHDLYDRPHLQEGFHAFMQQAEKPPLLPFLRIGVTMLFSHPAHAEAYRGALFAALPPNTFINEQHRKFLYGAEILILGSISVPETTLRAVFGREELQEALSLWAEAFPLEAP